MFCRKKKIWTALLLIPALSGSAFLQAGAAYLTTGRDTSVLPGEAIFEEEDFADYELLYETDKVRFYWREDRDILVVEDKESGYYMKTGADLPFSSDVKDAVEELIDAGASHEEIMEAAESYADDLNTTYVGIANSLITIEYYESDKIKYLSSASESGAESVLSQIEGGDENQFVLTVTFTNPDITLNVYITLGEDSISYYIPADEMGGTKLSVLAAIDITPFLGASGGIMNVLNEETYEWEEVENYRIPGYVLVPDGSGSLICFVDNTSTFNSYAGDVYGQDYATETYYSSELNDDVPVKNPVMPVFGIAQGNGQAAFVAWADEGAEYMEIIVNPDETKSTSYTWGYPRFEYNINYYQVYDQQGSGYFTQMEELFSFDIQMTYQFLFGDGSDGGYAADYTGMALAYRQHLLETGVLTLEYDAAGGTLTPSTSDGADADKTDDALNAADESDETVDTGETSDEVADIPIRLDFIMADSKSDVIGTAQVVVTTAEEVGEILDILIAEGITNINCGLLGWQRKGETLSKPYKLSFSSAIGTKSDFAELIEEYAAQGIEISLSRDLVTINREMTSYYNTAIKHISNWYVSVDKSEILSSSLPTALFTFAMPTKAATWLTKLAEGVSGFSNALTVSGMTNVLTSTYNRDGAVTTLTEAVALYQETFEKISDDLVLNLENPNQYLWAYTDKYLQIPVSSSQYIYETDSVPFLQMVLYGTMEMYAPYANFSFYTQDCILRMIDYNIYPSFVISEDASYYLMDTYSADLYSTEFELYEDLIVDIYGQINAILSQVKGWDWVDRETPENGVSINTYEKDGETRSVIINYTDTEVTYLGSTVAAESAAVVR